MARHKHLYRLPVWLPSDTAVIYFITCCTAERRACLANPQAHDAIRRAWQRLDRWRVGRYVVMPDHLHFFTSPCDREEDLSQYLQAFRSLVTRQLRPAGFPYPLWQREFFDHLLRSHDSYDEKWHYVWQNPIRKRLVANAEDWPYAGEIHQLEL
jgi:REP element-mobilizing transposase RayT